MVVSSCAVVLMFVFVSRVHCCFVMRCYCDVLHCLCSWCALGVAELAEVGVIVMVCVCVLDAVICGVGVVVVVGN